VRSYAREGMAEKAREFKEQGSRLYLKQEG
jgi:hypothetical protein